MKKMRTVLALALVVVLCMSMCACSAITNLVSNTTYNTGDLKEGYSNVGAIDGVKFCVPSDMKDDALGEMEFLALTLSAMENEEDMEKLMKSTFEVKDSTTYMLMNYSEGLFGVSPIDLDESLENCEDQKDLAKALNDDDSEGIDFGNSYIKSTLNGVVKMICPITAEFDAEEFNTKEDLKFEGHIAVVENEDGDAYMMLALFVEGTDDASEMSKYIAKSLEYTGEELAEPDEDDEDDEDWEDWEDEDENDDETVTATPSDDDKDDEDEDKNSGSNTEVTPPVGNFNGKLKDFQMQIDGKTVTLPIKVSDLESTLNLKLDEDDAALTMEKNKYTIITLENGDRKLYVKAVNTKSDTAIAMKDCDVFSISADRYDIYGYGSGTLSPKVSIILPGNVVVYKTTYDEVLAAYGTPDETRNNEESDFIYLEWKLTDDKYDYYTKMEITIEKETNLVYDFEYSKMPD